ncbi:hypothetical protein NHL50_14170 [Acidimicrobiia bacterium EGI L10123]|uniref:hypothetical protein n=1 Tax=Salinilacustrithrix flava TaxID=2957203 RepID=UPI003D7C17A5|nr:hypothetical protein [Acidimicrobiia bacterium EGI L10123]
MTRRRTIAAGAALAAVALAGTVGAPAATADPAVRVSDDYIACVGVRTIDVATCVEEPLGPILDVVLP